MARGVEAGYRIIEEYVRQGQEMARAFMPDRNAGSSSRALTDRLVRSASDFAGLLSEFLQGIATEKSPPASGTPDQGDFGIEHPDAPSLSLQLVGNNRADVRVDLNPGAWRSPLAVTELRAEDGKASPIRGVHLKTGSDQVRVSIRIDVPARQPAGTYMGRIVGETDGAERGCIAVTVRPRGSAG